VERGGDPRAGRHAPLKRPSPSSLKKVNAENLANLGAERLAQILSEVAGTQPDLKRRLRMELAAEQGPEHLAAEIDKRLVALETSRGKVTWRRRPAFTRDLDALRGLIADRMAALDRPSALARMWQFMDTARQVFPRLRDREGGVEAVFGRAAADVGHLIAGVDAPMAAAALVEAVVKNPTGWAPWLPLALAHAPTPTADAALRLMSERRGAAPGWITLIRQLADAAGDVDAFRATYTADALDAPGTAADLARRYLAAARIDEAGDILERAAPQPGRPGGRNQEPDFDLETTWIDYLDQLGRSAEAQAVRWASFERTLSVERARAFIGRLKDFQDVEAENRAFDLAAKHPDFQLGLKLLMDWPTVGEAARMIQSRPDDVNVTDEQAELWAAMLRARQPGAANILLRKAAAAAFRRRDFKTCDRLTAEADTITP
jgi:hypothetical protein